MSPEEEQFTRLRTERKHFLDTIKMIAYRAETSLASLLGENLARPDDAHSLLRQIFQNEADLTANTLTVRLHHFTHAAHDHAIQHICSPNSTRRRPFSHALPSLLSSNSGQIDFTRVRRAEIRLREVRAEDNLLSLRLLAPAFDYAARTDQPDESSGLVEMQRHFAKLRR